MDKSGYSCSLGNGEISLFQYSNMIGISSLVGNLYKLDIYVSHINESLHTSNCGIKLKLTYENSSMLWHKRLGHISKERIQRLVLEGIFYSLNFLDLKICIEFIKGKQTNVRKVGATRSSSVLELIHIDICGSFPIASWNGQKYFITFIDNYSHYGYLYLIHKKSQSLDVFISYKSEVENQLGKKIKAIKFDRGNEYYGRYDR